jgi:zinc protease
MVVCASGQVQVDAVVRSVREAFDSVPSGSPTLLHRPPPLRDGPRFEHVKHKDSQSEVRVCFRSFGEDDPDCVALEFLVRVLDDGMSTRLHRRMTDDSGLAYDVYASRDAYEDTGLLEIGASVEHGKFVEVLATALDLLDTFRREPVTDEELEIAKRRYHWELRELVDDPGSVSDYFGTSLLFGRPASLEQLRRNVERVDAAAIQAVARRVMRPENLYVVCVGKLTKAHFGDAARLVEGFC